MNGASARQLLADSRGPLVVTATSAATNLAEFFIRHEAECLDCLIEHGALLFRNFSARTVADFDEFVSAVTPRRLDYIYRSTPRTAVGHRIFTATEYPPNQEIPLHNENAYQRQWPMMLALYCALPARSGGETPIADMRKVTAALHGELLDRFERLGVKYVRHYRPHVDLSWQSVFGTNDRSALSDFCIANGIDHAWLDGQTLRTSQVCQGVAYHPRTQARVFFNQAHLFHVSNLGPTVAQALSNTFGLDRLPRHALLGDGTAIPSADLEAIRLAFRDSAVAFKWTAGDVLLLDNMQFAHGRRAFIGERKVFAALMDSHSAEFGAGTSASSLRSSS